MKYDILIIGGGIIGSAINYELSKYDLKILQLEKNPYLGNETTTGNSGVIHGGFDAGTGKLTAITNVRGRQLWVNEIFKDLDFPRKQVNSLVVSFDKEEHAEIEKLYQRGLDNGVEPEHLKVLDKNEVMKLEPGLHNTVYSALLCTNSWAIDPVKATHAFVGVAIQNNSKVLTNSEVTSIEKVNNEYIVTVNNQEKFITKYIVNAAGHYADKISEMAGGEKYNLKTRRGQYIVLNQSENKKVNNIIFMVPTIYGKGIIVAPMLDGRILVGPTSKDNVKKEDTRVLEKEIWTNIENIGRNLITNLDYSKTELLYAGSRPIYSKTDDFLIREDKKMPGLIHVAGIKSPGISGAPYIAKIVSKLLQTQNWKWN